MAERPDCSTGALALTLMAISVSVAETLIAEVFLSASKSMDPSTGMLVRGFTAAGYEAQ